MSDQERESVDQGDQRGVVKIFGKKQSEAPKRVIFAAKHDTQLTSPSPVAEEPTPMEPPATAMEPAGPVNETFVEEEVLPELEELEERSDPDAPPLMANIVELPENKVELPEELQALLIQVEPEETLKLEHPLEAKVRELAELANSLPPIPDENGEKSDAGEDWLLLEGEPSRDIAMLLDGKVREFHFLGYEHVTSKQIWSYFQQLRKRRPQNLHELVNAILSLQPQAVMNYDLQAAYRHVDESLEDILNDLK